MVKNLSVLSTIGKKPIKRHLPKVGTILGKNFKMNYEHRQIANSILSRLKDGEEFSQSVIRTALIDAGDLAPDRGERLDSPIPTESEAFGATGGAGLVAGCQDESKKTAWAGWSKYLDCRNGETT